MLAAYGVDVLGPGLSNRRMRVLIDRLPAHARTSPDASASWSTESHLLANIFDAVQALTWTTIRLSASKARVRQPRPIPRPKNAPKPRGNGPSQPQTGKTSWADAMRQLAGTDGVRSSRG